MASMVMQVYMYMRLYYKYNFTIKCYELFFCVFVINQFYASIQYTIKWYSLYKA